MTTTNILLFGRSGAGKSTIGNMLIDGDLKPATEASFYYCDDLVPGTLSANIKSNEEFLVLDSVGIGSHPKAVTRAEVQTGVKMAFDSLGGIIKYFETAAKQPFHHICLVVPATRGLNADKPVHDAFSRAFCNNATVQNTVLIVTHCTDGETWVDRQFPTLKELYPSLHLTKERIIAVDFPGISDKTASEEPGLIPIYQTRRSKFRTILIEKLRNLSSRPVYINISAEDLSVLFDILWNTIWQIAQQLPVQWKKIIQIMYDNARESFAQSETNFYKEVFKKLQEYYKLPNFFNNFN